MYRPNNFGAVDLKTGLPILDEKSFLKILVLPFSSKLDWGCRIVSIAKTFFNKIRAFIRFMKFLSSEVALYL